MGRKQKFTKTELRRALEDTDGHLGMVAARLGVARSTVYRYMERYPELEAVLKSARARGRDEIVEVAQSKLMAGLLTGDARLIMFALRHYDRDGVPGAVSIEGMLAPDVVEIMRREGIEASDVVREFEAMMRQVAEANR